MENKNNNTCHRCNTLDPTYQHVSDLSLCVMELKKELLSKNSYIAIIESKFGDLVLEHKKVKKQLSPTIRSRPFGCDEITLDKLKDAAIRDIGKAKKLMQMTIDANGKYEKLYANSDFTVVGIEY